jgi:hypothetical protein
MPTGFRPLMDCLRQAAGLSEALFLKEQSHPVLLWSQDLEWTGELGFQYQTLMSAPGKKLSLKLPAQTASQAARSLVIDIRKQVTTTPAHMICVGRAANNDIIFKDRGVSKFHAYFVKLKDEDSFALVDANSTNGTRVNNVKLLADQKKSLVSRDLIKFGSAIQMMYLTARGFYEFLQQLRRSGIS